MDEICKQQCKAVWQSFKLEILPNGKKIREVTRDDDMSLCIQFLKDRSNFIRGHIRCGKCDSEANFNMRRRAYRCTRWKCGFERAWTVGTIFAGLTRGVTVAHVLGFFAIQLIHEGCYKDDQLTKILGVSRKYLRKWNAYMFNVLDWWKSGLAPTEEIPAEVLADGTYKGFDVFIDHKPREERVWAFFEIASNYNQES